jgi:ubiquinone/menaquinone biosynthesis C-methylase UbiE
MSALEDWTAHPVIAWIVRALRGFFEMNSRISSATERRFDLPSDKPLWRYFETEAMELIRALPDGALALDLGGGRRSVYAHAVDSSRGVRIVAVDLSAEELEMNNDVSDFLVADVAEGLPLPDQSAELILSRALLEHVDGVPAAVGHMARVLRPGGVSLHLVPCRYSLFGMAARILPFEPLLRLVHAVRPATRGQVEFDVHYDHCYPEALEKLFRDSGFQRVDVHLCWGQPGYFEEVFPLFVLHAAYARTLERLDLRRLAAYVVIRAER